MRWARILAPLSGAHEDEAVLRAAEAMAAPFEAELAAVYVPIDPADLMPWTGDGFLGGAQVAALDGLREAAAEGERITRARFEAVSYPNKSYLAMGSPVWPSFSMEARLADLVVFGPMASQGIGPLAEIFQQVLIEERRPVLIARGDVAPPKVIAVAWDGGREATDAARRAVPMLHRAARVVILAATKATPRTFKPRRLGEYLCGRGVKADIEVLPQSGDAAQMLIAAAKTIGADLLVGGAFGHPRFQQFIFGGVTRGLLTAKDGPPLFLSN